jgi:hypothetical protein
MLIHTLQARFQQASRPFNVHIDASQDGAEIVNGVADRVRAELLRSIGFALHPHLG